MTDTEIPLDTMSLNLLLESLNAHFVIDDDGNHQIVGADFTTTQLYEFWSGVDPEKFVQLTENVTEYTGGPVIHHSDMIRALIGEVMRLRNRYEPEP